MCVNRTLRRPKNFANSAWIANRESVCCILELPTYRGIPRDRRVLLEFSRRLAPEKSKGKHNISSVELHCQCNGVDICAVLSSICKKRGNIKFGRIVQSTGVTKFIGLLWVFAFFPGR
jgi:hypothetical protein